MRARQLGLSIGSGAPGPNNAITDVAGVRVGHTTLIEGDSIRTGVSVIFPHEGDPGTDPGLRRLPPAPATSSLPSRRRTGVSRARGRGR